MLVHIALGSGRKLRDGQRIGHCVHRAITDALKAPLQNRFQIVTEQGADLANGTSSPDATGTDQAAIVLIYLTARYSGRKKRALLGRIAELLNIETPIDSRHVVVGLIDTPSENWSFGYGETQYLQMMAYQLP
jgi:hypothetical protein